MLQATRLYVLSQAINVCNLASKVRATWYAKIMVWMTLKYSGVGCHDNLDNFICDSTPPLREIEI